MVVEVSILIKKGDIFYEINYTYKNWMETNWDNYNKTPLKFTIYTETAILAARIT